jgi:preprotein translocase subunit SecA
LCLRARIEVVVSGLRGRIKRFLQQPGTADLRRYQEILPEITARETRLRALTDAELAAAVRAASGGASGPISDAGICSFGREAARRGLGEVPYDVQLLGTLALLAGNVAEMATGEGKTLSGAIAAAGYALRGRSVHVMSVNDYLARRDAEWMRPVYDLLGVTVGWIGQDSTPAGRRSAYAAQVTYGPVSEIGFDVLRDRLCTDPAELIAPEPDVVLIDEADSVLIDEAKVPLVLAGAVQQGDADLEMAEIVRRLSRRVHYEIDEDARNVRLTDSGARAAEKALGGIDLYTGEHLDTLTRLNLALHAHALLQRDVDYIITDGKVRLVDESRGRVASLQRWPDGLHAAVEAKEGLSASDSGEILDSITIRSLVCRYPTVCGMTGTAVAVGAQLREFYQLEVAVIAPNRPCIRADEPDRLYATVRQKEDALAEQVIAAHAQRRPVLIGTLDVAESERVARRLHRAGVECTVLNAKNDAQEAAIIAEAGSYGAVTVSTQMAGRGTDIRLGGTAATGNKQTERHNEMPGAGPVPDQDCGSVHDQVAALGGLYVIGTGRHVTSRLDDQLRGRSGRQGDPGGSVFFLSMQDELIVQYGRQAAPGGVQQPDGRIQDARADWLVGHAQRVAEGVLLEIHRNTWRYNKLIEDQRRIVLAQRDQVLDTEEALRALAERCPERYAELSAGLDHDVLAEAARQIVLYHLDRGWADYLAEMAHIREGIHLRSLGRGLNPLDQFHAEAVRRFGPMMEEIAARSAETFAAAAITADGADLAASGLKRPTSTWTYLVQDDPFGSPLSRAARSLGRLLGRSD